ncbi:hypothetical protein HDU99_006513, partial [Rhizoclosmatium hyalinum]
MSGNIAAKFTATMPTVNIQYNGVPFSSNSPQIPTSVSSPTTTQSLNANINIDGTVRADLIPKVFVKVDVLNGLIDAEIGVKGDIYAGIHVSSTASAGVSNTGSYTAASAGIEVYAGVAAGLYAQGSALYGKSGASNYLPLYDSGEIILYNASVSAGSSVLHRRDAYDFESSHLETRASKALITIPMPSCPKTPSPKTQGTVITIPTDYATTCSLRRAGSTVTCKGGQDIEISQDCMARGLDKILKAFVPGMLKALTAMQAEALATTKPAHFTYAFGTKGDGERVNQCYANIMNTGKWFINRCDGIDNTYQAFGDGVVAKTKSGQIYLGNLFFDNLAINDASYGVYNGNSLSTLFGFTPKRSRAAIFLHELTHAFCHTEDFGTVAYNKVEGL